MIDRLQRVAREHGAGGLLRRAAEHARDRVYLDEQHVWYELDVHGERPRKDLADGLSLVEAADDQVPHIEKLASTPAAAAHELRARGGRLFFVLEGDEPLFACWLHTRETPVLAASGGWLPLPDGMVCLEDSVTAPAARGRGIAPAAWAKLADRVGDEGARWVITKVAVENAPSRKAVEKAGFRESAVMRMRRRGWRRRVAVVGDGAVALELASRLVG